jgi:hypothetical protein
MFTTVAERLNGGAARATAAHRRPSDAVGRPKQVAQQADPDRAQGILALVPRLVERSGQPVGVSAELGG